MDARSDRCARPANGIARFFLDRVIEPGPAVNLAVLRLAVFGLLLYGADAHQATRFADLPGHLRNTPGGGFLFFDWLPVQASWAKISYWLFLGSCWAAFFGVFSRVSAALVVVFGVYLLGIPQIYGTVRHYHHLLWFAAILAASPSGDALSLDRVWRVWRRGACPEQPSPSVAYGLPIRLTMILVGFIFFFPGFWKLYVGGLDWALGDNLIHQMHWKWAQNDGITPGIRIDQYPSLVKLGGLMTLGLELFFLPLQFIRRLRVPLILSAFLFHMSTQYFFLIAFPSLWVCYLCFLPIFGWLQKAEARGLSRIASSEQKRSLPSRPIALLWVASFLIIGVVWSGATRTIHGWPFACYPTFHNKVGEAMPMLEVLAKDEHGEVHRIKADLSKLGQDKQRLWGLMWALVLDKDQARQRRGLESYWRDVANKDTVPARLVEVRFYRTMVSSVPKKRNQILNRTVLYQRSLPIPAP